MYIPHYEYPHLHTHMDTVASVHHQGEVQCNSYSANSAFDQHCGQQLYSSKFISANIQYGGWYIGYGQPLRYWYLLLWGHISAHLPAKIELP